MASDDVRLEVLEFVGDELEEDVACVPQVVDHALFPSPFSISPKRTLAWRLPATPPLQDVLFHKDIKLGWQGNAVPSSFDLFLKLSENGSN